MYRRGETGQIARALRVLGALRGFKHGRRIAEIAQEVGASERTVRRDLGELRDAGFDIEIAKVDQRSIALLAVEKTYSPVSITKSERLTLLAVRNVFEVLRGTPFLDDVHAVMAKLEQRMNDKERGELRAFAKQFVYLPDHGTKSYAGKEDIIDAILTGVLSHKVVQYRYGDARGRARHGYFAPYGMVLYRHGLYAIGGRLPTVNADATGAPLGILAIERFTEAEHLRAHEFEVPPGSTSASTCARSVRTSPTRRARTMSSSSSVARRRYTRRRAPGTNRSDSTRAPMAGSGSRSASRPSRLWSPGCWNGVHTPARSLRNNSWLWSAASLMPHAISTSGRIRKPKTKDLRIDDWPRCKVVAPSHRHPLGCT